MKYLYTILIVAFVSVNGFSQAYMEKVAEKTCECAESIPDSLSGEKYAMRLGVCMIDAALPYKKQIKKDFDIDLNDIGTSAEQLGQVVGLKMASFCPATLLNITNRVNGTDNTSDDEMVSDDEKMIKGNITKVNDEFFVFFTIKQDDGKSRKYYWLSDIESKMDLENEFSLLVGKYVELSYNAYEFFDPKIQDYRQYNVITSMNEIVEY